MYKNHKSKIYDNTECNILFITHEEDKIQDLKNKYSNKINILDVIHIQDDKYIENITIINLKELLYNYNKHYVDEKNLPENSKVSYGCFYSSLKKHYLYNYIKKYNLNQSFDYIMVTRTDLFFYNELKFNELSDDTIYMSSLYMRDDIINNKNTTYYWNSDCERFRNLDTCMLFKSNTNTINVLNTEIVNYIGVGKTAEKLFLHNILNNGLRYKNIEELNNFIYRSKKKLWNGK